MGRVAVQIFAVALCLCVAACGRAKVYPQPIAQMHEKLAQIDELPPVFGSSAPEVSLRTSDPSSIAWLVMVDGAEAMRFTARLEPESDTATRMVLDLVGASSGEHGDVEKRLGEHPELRRLYLVAMTEQIESHLENRPFDMTKTYGALAAAAAANAGAISGRMKAPQ